MLRQAYEKAERKLPGLDELQKILLASVRSYAKAYIHLDAIDECPENDGARHDALKGIARLLDQAPNVRAIVTSRDVPDIRSLMENCNADPMPIVAQTVHADIQKYISTQMSCDRKLSQLDSTTKTLIEQTLSQKADGM